MARRSRCRAGAPPAKKRDYELVSPHPSGAADISNIKNYRGSGVADGIPDTDSQVCPRPPLQ